jgi:manganese/iron transport system substrate-binding protein
MMSTATCEEDGTMDQKALLKPLACLGIAVLLLMMVGACGNATSEANRSPGQQASELAVTDLEAVPLAEGEKLKVVATTNIVGDVVSNVGGDLIDLITLMGPGVDPHSYVPTPAHIAAIHDAHLVFANGAGLEANLEETLTSAGGDAVEVVVSEGLELRQMEDPTHGGHAEDDPHIWLDVQNVIHWVEIIRQALSALDPEHAEIYRANAAAYTLELENLDAWIVAEVAAIPEANRRLVTNHPAFGYFADRYGLEQLGALYPVSPSSEPSAQEIAALEDAIRQYDVPAVFAESTVNPRMAQQVAQDTGVRLVALYTGSLGEPGSGVESYLALIRFNVQAIADALR